MPPGGARTASPGAVHSNRSDLTGSAGAYGDGINKAAIAAATPGSPTTTGGTQGPPMITPGDGSLVPLDAPSLRPDEPVTAGLPVGPGPGPADMAGGPSYDPDIARLRALAQAYPSRDLFRLISLAETRA